MNENILNDSVIDNIRALCYYCSEAKYSKPRGIRCVIRPGGVAATIYVVKVTRTANRPLDGLHCINFKTALRWFCDLTRPRTGSATEVRPQNHLKAVLTFKGCNHAQHYSGKQYGPNQRTSTRRGIGPLSFNGVVR